ncbi:hypothetical protein NGB36_03715 [Streptomyces sp. RB6PN25]|uniref:Uncharacterized protein n=2 Tax=Streptomyces humicola TaxID=2953240 RepID=A0ABT1PPX0_9ACTN|nr:hypothetical protein [Streptomyces humicola]
MLVPAAGVVALEEVHGVGGAVDVDEVPAVNGISLVCEISRAYTISAVDSSVEAGWKAGEWLLVRALLLADAAALAGQAPGGGVLSMLDCIGGFLGG